MDQIKYRTLREAPAEVRKSLEILDDIIDECSLSLDASSNNASQLDDVPSEVRHSLELLDDILDKFEEEGKKLDEIEISIDSIEILKDENLVSENVESSLKVLDSTLDEIECNSKVSLRIGDQSSTRKSRHEDIRRSLEVLDSVLAEFDDCLDSWDSSAASPAECKFSESIPELRKKFERTENQPNGKLSNGLSKSQGRLPLEKFSLDGVTSHNSSNSASEQPKVSSPPPVPKRSPTTKLSEERQQQQNRFTFPSDSLEDCFDDSEGPLSQQQISTLSSPQKNGDARPPCDTSDKCSNCGRGLKAVIMDAPSNEPSPFMQKRQLFEPKAHQELSPGPSVGRSRSFKVKRMVADIMDSSTEPSSLPADLSFESSSSSSFCSVRDCDCRDRIRHLNEKFAETKRLLRLKKIKVLDCDPPAFVPPTPVGDAVVPQHTGRLDDPSEDQSFYSADVSNNCVSSSQNEDSLLCNRCSNASHLNETIEDIPNLLPTDALNRPHLGFSYSMEEDLPPGVKEIQMTTSTPKSGVSPKTSLFRTKESNLSTFSQSVSSLGYVSSQSDLELNNISTVPDKVPVSTFKSMTLPNGLDRSPFYSAAEDDLPHQQQKSWQNDHNDNRVRKSAGQHMSVEELRSAPQDGEEKPKKKHFRGFSRKSKKDKTKNDDSLSLKSDISTDEGVILKKLSTLDGSSIVFDAAALADDKTGGGVEKKRWSLLRSIIGKKSP